MSDLPYISAHVGRNSKNRPVDVAIVQSLLNEYFRTKELSPSKFFRSSSSSSFLPVIPNQLLYKENYSFKVDGLIGVGPVCSLCEAIGQFQEDFIGMKKPDGRVDPNGTTFRKLLNNNTKNRRDIISQKPVLHNILSRVNSTQCHLLFNKQFDGTPGYPALKSKNGFDDFITFLKNDPDIQDIRWAAYILATAYLETGFTLLPVEEDGKGTGKPYGVPIEVTDIKGIRGKKNTKYKNVYYGRGYVQITWEDNYTELGTSLGFGDEFHINPEKVLEPSIAYKIMSYGMRNGSFTLKKLSDYINDKQCDYLHSRRIINGDDRNKIIAGYAMDIELLLRLSTL